MMTKDQKKILVTDDSLFMRDVLKDILKKQNKQVKLLFANNGKTAYKKFVEEKPSLVLLDIVMPEGEEEGISVLKKVMKMNPRAKVVMVSALGQDAIRNKCKKLGAAAYIVKPFDEEQIIEIVEKYLD